MKPSTVITEVACDSPFFIRTQQNYLKAWYYFMTVVNQPYKFFVNPSPQTVADVTMNRQKIDYWIDGPIKCTPEIFSLSSNFIFSRDRITDSQFNQNNFLVPFMSANEGFLSSVVVGDIPQFKYYFRLCSRATLSELEQAFEDLVDARCGLLRGDREFDFEIKMHQTFLPDKINYLTEVVKQSLAANKRVIGVVDVNHLDFLAENWAESVQVNKETGKTRVRDLREFYEPENEDIENITEFIEKLVYVDFLYSNPITHYFIKFKKFPYELRGDFSARLLRDPESLMILWYFYYDKLQDKMAQARKRQSKAVPLN